MQYHTYMQLLIFSYPTLMFQPPVVLLIKRGTKLQNYNSDLRICLFFLFLSINLMLHFLCEHWRLSLKLFFAFLICYALPLLVLGCETSCTDLVIFCKRRREGEDINNAVEGRVFMELK